MGGIVVVDIQNMLANRFRGVASNAPASYEVALSLTELAADGTGMTEPAVGAYARSSINCNTTDWNAPTTDGIITNAVGVAFPTATADWGRALQWVLCDPTTHAVRLWGDLASSGYNIVTGADPVLDPGAIVIDLGTAA